MVVQDNQSPSCLDTVSKFISVACNPTANITSDTVCLGDTTRFSSAFSLSGGTDSIISAGLYEPYTWYNSGGISIPPIFDDTVMYIFNNSGIQDSTKLIVINTHGCSDTTWHRAYVRANPIAGIDWSGINSNFCRNDSITFVSSNGNNPNSQITWWFNPGGTPSYFDPLLNEFNPTVIFTGYGQFPITVAYQDQYNCSDTLDTIITIHNLPQVNFTAKNACANQDILFTNTSSISNGGNALSYAYWEFTDPPISNNVGAPITDPYFDTVSHSYPSISQTTGGYVSATLTITDNIGCISSMNKDSIELYCKALISSEDICQGQEPFIFTDISNLNSSIFNHYFDTINRNWLFNNLEPNPVINYTTWQFNPITDSPINDPDFPSGTYSVNLFVITNKGCSDFISDSVKYEQKPVINFDTLIYNYPEKPCLLDGETIDYTYTNYSQYYNNYLMTIYDSYQNNYIANSNNNIIGQPYTYTLPGSGIYDFDLLLENQINNNLTCVDSISFKIKVYPKPIAEFLPCDTSGCDSLLIQFIDITNTDYAIGYINSGGNDYIESWTWTFDNGMIDTNEIPDLQVYNTTEYKDFYPELFIRTNNGCTSTKICNVFVKDAPLASFVTPPLQGSSPPFGTYWFDSDSKKGNGQPAKPDEYDFTWILDESGGNTIIFNANHERVIQGVSDSLLFQYNSFPDPINGFSNVNVNLLIEDKFDVNGIKCKDSVKYTFPIEYYNGLYVPNSLAPGSGSKYDEWTYFLPKGKSLIQYSLTIFDKFGNMVFKTTKLDVSGSPLEAWDGTRNGIPLPQGTYVWKIQAVFSDGSVWPGIGYSGNPDDPHIGLKDKGKTSGAIYLIR